MIRNVRRIAPMQILAAPLDAEDIADTLVWLCSDAAGKTNGQRIALYGR